MGLVALSVLLSWNWLMMNGVGAGIIALGARIIGLVTGGAGYLGALTLVVALLWLLTIGQRLFGGAQGRRLTAAWSGRAMGAGETPPPPSIRV